MTKIISNGSKWLGQQQASLDELFETLDKHVLDATFKEYGDFINYNPTWLDSAKKFEGCTVIFGNFKDYSHVFNIITDDKFLISQFETAISKNKQREDYLNQLI